MIELTRLNGHPVFLNGDLIKIAEAAPDTMLTLVTGEKLLVRESCNEVAARMLLQRSDVLRAAWPEASRALSPFRVLRAQQQNPSASADDL